MSLSANLTTSRLLQSVWQELTGLGISRFRLTRRGCCAGRRKQRCISTVIGIRSPTLQTGRKFYHIAEFVNDELNIHANISSSELNIQVGTSVSGNLSNLIVPERDPVERQTKNSKLMKLCLANVRAVKSTSAALLDYFFSTDAELIAITETWLTPNDLAAKLEITPPGYQFVQRPSSDKRGGGVGLLYKDSVTIKKIEDGEKESFEFAEWNITKGSFRARLCTQLKCSWLLPTYVNEVTYDRVRDMDFTSAKKLKENLDIKIDSLDQNKAASRESQPNVHAQTAIPSQLASTEKKEEISGRT